MPELPEVDDAARRLRTATVGRTLVRVTALHPSQRRSLTAVAATSLAGRSVVAVVRRAKLQLVEFDSGHTLEVHFRMNGDWAMSLQADQPPRHERVRFDFSDGTRVSLVDSRALSVLTVHQPGRLALPAYGPEPLDDAWTAELFRVALSTRRGPIKPVLLDQRVVAGLGNIYAAESVWEARIDPRTPANTLSKARVLRLHEAIRTVLERAPAGRYYATEDARSSAEDDAWRVYGKEGEPCRRCGRAIKRLVQAGRSTFWCRCQR
ncbi:MAG TPA: bifunctional DNA-formamidopyrimidine glycosylase/DNA-(apurinic or apyrimidinic site) lyase [Gemmatimonas sp.]|nr:bifunctional DNA-formamidopyrimidine glycosylase/DNA-(apurinic or apyrimidinic site) lyase [Gemmatimonas sp.]